MKAYVLKYGNYKGGSQLGPLIRINEKYKDDVGLLAHEVEYVKQWWIVSAACLLLWVLFVPLHGMGLVFAWLPLVAYHLLCKIPAVQKRVEIRCWRVQLSKYPDDRSKLAAKHLSTMYSFKMTQSEALKALRK